MGMQIQAQLVIHGNGVEQRTCNVISLALQSGVSRRRYSAEEYARRGHHTTHMQARQQRAFSYTRGVSHTVWIRKKMFHVYLGKRQRA